MSKRGVPIIVVNPLRERGLERFTSPQDPGEMLTNRSTPIAQTYYQVKIGGDVALLKGMMKWLLEADAADLAAGGKGVLDHAFIAEHTDRHRGACARTSRPRAGTTSSKCPGCRAATSRRPRRSMPRPSA